MEHNNSHYRETVWRLHYTVSDAGVVLDSGLEIWPEAADLSTALATVTSITLSVTFDTLLFTGDSTLLVEYAALFTLHFTSEIRTADFSAFEAFLVSLWETGKQLLQLSIFIQDPKIRQYWRIFDKN